MRKTLWIGGLGLLYVAVYLSTFFVLGAGINYNRESFAAHVGIEVRDSSTKELVELYQILVERVTLLSVQVATDEDGVFMPSGNNMHRTARQSMNDLRSMYGGLVSYFPRPRAPIMSRVLSHMQIGGFFSPWSLEAHYNREIPAHRLPFLMAHELAHAGGHMREDEANFIAYLAGRHSDCVDFNYSAAHSGIVYVLNALHRVVDQDTYAQLFSQLPDQVRRDMAASRAFWAQFEGPVSEIATRANDAYLRVNRQEDGVRSYGKMVDLLLAYYRFNSR